ncbi:MAG TPA: helix-turn-helix transcriptional regulator [Geminicoccaceae bacterium]|nr:helix-turn-helix transcriptional regulator [Geminicoccaceae bacterium]
MRVQGEAEEPIAVALRVADPGRADRLAALLADVPGLRLVGPGESADVGIVDEEACPTPAPTAAGLLTPREAQVLELLAEGASNKAIARRLGISVHTAKFHVAHVLDKLDATGRADAVAHAARLGLLML